MSKQDERTQDSPPSVALPADRWVGALRIALFLPLGAFLLWVVAQARGSLNLRASNVGDRISSYCWAIVLLWLALGGLVLIAAGGRWLVYALWPGWIGLRVLGSRLVIALGPFGRRELDLGRFTATYRHELDEEDGLRSTEDFVPDEVEIQTRLPLLRHPDLPAPLNRLMDRFMSRDERCRLEALRPLAAYLRRDRGDTSC